MVFSISAYLFAGAVGALGFIYLYFRWAYTYWTKRGVPIIPPSFPFGNMRERVIMKQSGAELFFDFYWQLEGHNFGGIYQMTRPALVIRDPELIKQVLVKDFIHFQDRGIYVDEKGNPLSAHLFNLGGGRWRKLRAKLTPTFTSGKMRLMFGLMHECARELAAFADEAARAGEDVEFKEVLAKFTTDVIGSCAFGLQCNSMKDPDSEFRAMGRRVFQPSLSLSIATILLLLVPPLSSFFKIQIPEKDVSDFFLRAVKETVDYREKNKVKRNDFLQLLIQLKSKGEDGKEVANGVGHKAETITEGGDIELTDNLLAAQAFVFFLAGFETSSATMSFALHELALNQDVQTRLRNEINSVLEDSDGEFTYDSVMKMEYLDKVICETLRKYPPLPSLIRECTIPYTLPGTDVHIEKGTRMIIPVHAIQNDPKYFPEPDAFDPERFSEENKATRPNYVYMPFGEGPRLCIGMRFGQLQTKLGLAMLLQRYQFSLSEKTSLPVRFDPRTFLTASVGGTWLKISPAAT